MVKMSLDTIGDDSFVDTKGHCFICLDKVGSAQVPFKLKYFSRCLRLNEKVFARDKKETEDIPSYLKKGERSKVLLCEECSFIGGQYSDVYQQLEEIELKVLFLTDLIERRMRKGETDGNLSLKPSDLEAFHYAEKVRKEVMDKCSLKLKESRPRIRLCKVPEPSSNGSEVVESRRSVASRIAGQIKREELQLPEVMNGDDASSPESADLKKPPSYLLNRLGLNLDGTPKNSLNGSSKSFHSREHSVQNEVTGPAIKKTKKHDCDLCDASFDSLSDLQSHRNEVHFGKTFKCVAPCNKVMGSRKALNVHHSRCSIYKGALAEDLQFGNQARNRLLVNINGNSLENGAEAGAAPVQTHNVKRLLNPSTPKAKTGQGNSRKCKGCGKMFPNFACAKVHYNRVHLSLQPFSCSICKRKFSQKQHLDSHKRACHIAKKKYTSVKNETHATKTETVNDKIASVLRTMGMSKTSNAGKSEVPTPTNQSQLNGKPLSKTCKACGKVFRRSSNAINHYNSVHLKIKPFQCDICKRKFGVKKSLQRHFQTVHKGLATAQREDNLTMGMKSSPIAAPKRSDTNGKTMNSKTKPKQGLDQGRTCKVCRRKFSSFASYQRHYNSVHLKLSFKCEICHKTFTRKDTLIDHQKKAHLTEGKTVQVKNSVFKKKANGKEKTPTKKHRFACSICGNKYTELWNLKRHMKAAHLEGGTKFPCDFPDCGKQFKYRFDLNRHQKTHIQLQFSCLQPCQLVFNKEDELKEHQKTCETFQSA